jgi:hypothetical protein
MTLESILEINAAIRRIKGGIEAVLPKIESAAILSKNEDAVDISSKLKNPKESEKDFSSYIKGDTKAENGLYSPFKAFVEYISGLKTKVYNYYSSAKKKINKLKKSQGYKILCEIEDWGTIYYKPTFKKLVRLNPLGAMARYQEKLWLCITKNVKN